MNLRDFFDGMMRDNRSGAVSTTRTVYVGAFLVSSFTVLWCTAHNSITEWMIVGYLGAFVTGSLGSKAINATADVKGRPAPAAPKGDE